MTARILLILSLSALVMACATGRTAAPTAETTPAIRAGTPPRQASRLSIARPEGWRQTQAGDGSAFFLSNRAGAVIRISLRPAEGTPADVARSEAAELARAGHRVDPVDAAADAYASVDWSGDLGAGPRNGRIAIRRPSGAPGSFVIMSAFWPADAGPALAEEIGLIMLLTTAE